MDPITVAALIGAGSALGGGLIATTGNLLLDWSRRNVQRQQDEATRQHEVRQHRYDERKAAYEAFYTAIADAEQATLEFEARKGVMPADEGYDAENTSVDSSIARLQFIASDECLAAAEACSRAFYSWGWGSGNHTALYEAMNEFRRVVRVDLKVNESGYTRPLPEARRRKPRPIEPGGAES